MESDRFRPSRLGPAENERLRSFGRRSRSAKERSKEGESAAHMARWSRLRPARLLDWLLLAIEVAGALIVAWLAWQYLYTVYFDTAPRRVTPPSGTASPAQGEVRATPSPTATLVAEVAPPLIGGPSEQATPTPTIEPQLLLPTRLRIPAMSLDSPVREVKLNMGVWEVAPMDIGHHEGTGNPGQTGNVVLAGHRDINSALFRELDRLEPGDEVFVSNSLGEYRYVVKESLVISPHQTEVMAATDDSRVTLITCTPIGLATQRLVVVAVLDDGP